MVRSKFDPAFSLLGKDVEIKEVEVEGGLKVACVLLHIKSRKENRLSEVWLEILEVRGNNCPVMALQQYMAVAAEHIKPDLPFFSQEAGQSLTKSLFNEELKRLLSTYVSYS